MSEKLEVEVVGNIASFARSMKEAVSVSQSASDKITKSTNAISGAITSSLAGIATIGAFATLGKAIIGVSSEFQKFSAVLGNTLGSDALANLKLKEIQEFAKNTPFAVNELTGAFVKLANSGFKPTGDEMTKLGDLASSTGKSFDQLAEAILDAQTGEFERLKEFGIRAKDAGDKVIFTFKGVQTTVEKSSDAIRDYVTALGAAEGVSGAMAKISATLGGKINDLGDSWDQMLLSVGANTNGVFVNSISIIDTVIRKVTEFNRQLATASTYDLGSDWGKQINRAINPFSDKGPTELEKATYVIQKAQEVFAGVVNKSLAAAKSVGDYDKALAKLKTSSNTSFSDPFFAYLNMEMTKKTQAAINAEFKKAAGAIADARQQFIDNPKTNAANFGSAGAGYKVEADKIKEIYKRLQTDLSKAPLQLGADKGDIKESNLDALQKAISALVDNGIKPASKAIQELIEKQQILLGDRSLLADSSNIGNSIKASDPLTVTKNAEIKIVATTNMTEVISKLNKDFEDMSASVLESGIGDAFGAVGSAIGESIANGGNILASLGQSLLGIVGGIAIQLGKAAIAVGVTMEGIKKAFTNPFTAIAAGIALIAIGSFISGSVSKMTQGKQGSSSGPTRAFANGGIVSGPTNALIGEYPGARSNPEVVAPLNKLESMLGKNKSETVVVIPELRMGYDAMYVAFKRGEKNQSRT